MSPTFTLAALACAVAIWAMFWYREPSSSEALHSTDTFAVGAQKEDTARNAQKGDGNLPFSRASLIPWKTKPVRRVRVSRSARVIHQHFGGEEPVVIEGSRIRDWPAFENWQDAAQVAAALRNSSIAQGGDGRVRAHISPLPNVRMHSAVNPLGAIDGVIWKRPFTEVMVDPDGLVQHRNQNPKPEGPGHDTDSSWLYFFSPLGNFSAQYFSPDIGSYEFLAYGGDTNAMMEQNIWIGQPNVTTPLHYDAVHNAYAQLRGQKHFTLVPPLYWRCLHLFPGIHPSARMTQIPWESVAEPVPSLKPLVDQLHANARQHERWACSELMDSRVVQEVTLKAGEILYLPPFWFHRVEAVGSTPSMSLSVHSESDALDVRGITNSRAVPGVRNATFSESLVSVKEYLATVVSELSWDMGTFAQDMLDSMYAPLQYDRGTEHLWDKIGEAEAIFVKHARLSAPAGAQISTSDSSHEADMSDVRLAATSTARGIAATGSALDTAAVEILVAQYIEDVLCDTFGAAFVAPALKYVAGIMTISNAERESHPTPSVINEFVPGDQSTFARPGDWVRVKLSVASSEEELWKNVKRQNYDFRVGGARQTFKALEEVVATYSLGTQLVMAVPFEYGFGSRGSKELGIDPFQNFVMEVKIQMVVPPE